jgi:phosphatidylinositol glycan class O
MTSGEFTYIENPKFFNLENILIADMSSYQYFKEAILKPTPDY